MKLIQRHGYIEFLRRNRERSIIKVVSGIRRWVNRHCFVCLRMSY